MCYVRKEFNECLRVIEEQLKLCNGQSEYPLYIKALILRQQGRIEESLTTFQAALCLNPSNINNLKQVGRSLYLLGKHKTALDVFEEAEQLNSEDREIWHYKGMCYMLYNKQYERAIECFETANSIQRHESSFIHLGRIYRILNKEDEALLVYQEALETCPENPELLTTIGLLYLKIGNNTKAFEYLGNALTYDPKSSKAILAAGSIIQDNQDMDVALIKYRVAAVQTPNSAQLWNNIGMCFFGKAKYIAAVACLKKGSYIAPFEWIISYNLGVVHLSCGQFASAFQYFSTAINLQPSYAKAYMYLAVALAKLEDFENSCAAYEKSIELSSEDYLTFLNYSITLYLNDELEKSKENFARFEVLFNLQSDSGGVDIDSDILKQADLLKDALMNL
uniref:UDP-N-acetylglucosamine--peptide N-acetylglucosaminyltransferase SPINDLY n=1 Tax=Chromulina nebulosa TaxID=96789 RepID=A0A7S0ST62_9STRA